MDPHTITLPPLRRNPYRALDRDGLLAVIVSLEVANFRAELRADLLAEELKAARAHSRLLARKLAAAT